MARAVALRRTKSGRLASKRSKTGRPECSQAASLLARRQATPETDKVLGRCRSASGQLSRAAAARASGREALAQHLEHRAQGGHVTVAERLARAKALRAERAARPSRPETRERLRRALADARARRAQAGGYTTDAGERRSQAAAIRARRAEGHSGLAGAIAAGRYTTRGREIRGGQDASRLASRQRQQAAARGRYDAVVQARSPARPAPAPGPARSRAAPGPSRQGEPRLAPRACARGAGEAGEGSGRGGTPPGPAPARRRRGRPPIDGGGETRATVHMDAATHDVARRMFGPGVTPAQVASLGGAPDNATVHVHSSGSQLSLSVSGPGIQSCQRTITHHPDGTVSIHNDIFRLDTSAQGGGLGLQIFSRQIENAHRMGVSHIETLAYNGGPGWNGYYTWPRFGYDAPFPAHLRSSLPASLGRPATVLELMNTPAGRAWWKAHGVSFEAVFDLTPNSNSLKTLANYLQERAARGTMPGGGTHAHANPGRRNAR